MHVCMLLIDKISKDSSLKVLKALVIFTQDVDFLRSECALVCSKPVVSKNEFPLSYTIPSLTNITTIILTCHP